MVRSSDYYLALRVFCNLLSLIYIVKWIVKTEVVIYSNLLTLLLTRRHG